MRVISIIGKFDFQDECEMSGVDTILENYNIFVGRHRLLPLKMTSKKDLVAYYTYISRKNSGSIILSDRSYIDEREEESLTYDLMNVIKYYKKCKRGKKDFDKSEALQQIMWLRDRPEPQSYKVKLVNRVAEDGAKATTDGLHIPVYDAMREKWYNLMIENGWEEEQAYKWVYGWRRWLERENADEYGQYKLNIKEG